MRFRVTLTDSSEREFEALNWIDAARSASIWHEEVSLSACWTRHTNPVQIKSLEWTED